MANLIIVAAAFLTITLVLLFIWILMRRILKKNTTVSVEESSLTWKEVECQNCQRLMEKGYAFAGKGIFWTHKNAKKPGAFSHVANALENTFSIGIHPHLNMAWRCDDCKIIVIDHSRMLKIKKAAG